MTETSDLQLRPIRRALVSVSDKTGIVDFARELAQFNVEIISTGGTAKALRDAGITVRDISDVTGFPEMMDGRVKTLHPRVHGGLLAIRDNPEHLAAMQQHGIEPIDMVVVNLYPFAETITREGVTLDEAIEQIDIGGPAMIRSAAKNAQDVAVVVAPSLYDNIIFEMRSRDGSLSLATRRRLARSAFEQTAIYDMYVSSYLSSVGQIPADPAEADTMGITGVVGTSDVDTNIAEEFSVEEFKGKLPGRASWTIGKMTDLRYGENPHQMAALYQMAQNGGVANAEVLSGKEMSFNNYVDADAAWNLVSDFDDTACAIIKHTNPAGVGLGQTPAEAYTKALATDPVSAFGGIVAFNQTVDSVAAQEVVKIFTEVVIAPEYDVPALEILKAKKNLRVLRLKKAKAGKKLEFRQVSGGMLVQTADDHKLDPRELKVVTARQPTGEEIRALLFAWVVCKHTKSNAIVYARDGQTVGVGAGQMSRVDSVKIGAMRAQLPVAGSVLASDAFFPFRDGIDEAARHGITAVIQPGGSVRDDEVIAAANEHGLAMMFTGVRHFKH
ncbi:MAG TPA: bifunctional phosphoribosylaminoimidazolecarboxamide formyltransferase/IMP cyclohydrolase [Pyrinomonadaceae bacterium]|jgi:phosphoribosylaminoimidazolecarboxamide formyltransferase/IMP cyclohydrolase|nr:bifunctional phosphoribosylaminoimidazolecarboxamide formyltransferase/IMP cyclohydrolase [Pyrinomonadaceae bacterium]